jgi:hypothetical protein
MIPMNARRVAQALFHYAGGTWWIRNRVHRAIRILMYHRFPKQSRFEAQCAHLKKYYVPISLTDALAKLGGAALIPDRLVVVTVDDGYRDFYENAVPALNRYQIPSTVFLTTDLPDRNGWLWVDQVTWCIRQSKVREIELNLGGRDRWMFYTDEQRRAVATLIKEASSRFVCAFAVGRRPDAGKKWSRIRRTHPHASHPLAPRDRRAASSRNRRIEAQDRTGSRCESPALLLSQRNPGGFYSADR